MSDEGSGYAVGHCGKNTRVRIAIAVCQKTTLTQATKERKSHSGVQEFRAGNEAQECNSNRSLRRN